MILTVYVMCVVCSITAVRRNSCCCAGAGAYGGAIVRFIEGGAIVRFIEGGPIGIREADSIYLSPSQVRVFPNHVLKVA